jgi:uncharacterized membrane protein
MNGPELRIGDQDREAAITALGEHYAAGRLTKEEYDERAERAWAARTASQLMPLFADLPRPQSATRTAQPVPSRPAPHSAHPGWWAGTWMGPLLLVVIGLVVLTHLPVLLLLLLAWFFLVRSGRRRSRGQQPRQWSGPHGRGGWVR